MLQQYYHLNKNQFFKHILIFLHQYNSHIWTRLNQIWTYDLVEQIGMIHGCITPLQYKVGQFTLEHLGLGPPKTKISPLCQIHFTSLPRSLGQVTKSTLLNSSQFHITNATLPTKSPSSLPFLDCQNSLQTAWSWIFYKLLNGWNVFPCCPNFCPKKQKTTQFSKAL